MTKCGIHLLWLSVLDRKLFERPSYMSRALFHTYVCLPVISCFRDVLFLMLYTIVFFVYMKYLTCVDVIVEFTLAVKSELILVLLFINIS